MRRFLFVLSLSLLGICSLIVIHSRLSGEVAMSTEVSPIDPETMHTRYDIDLESPQGFIGNVCPHGPVDLGVPWSMR